MQSPQPLIPKHPCSQLFYPPKNCSSPIFFTAPVAKLSCVEASKAFLKSGVTHAHCFHLPISLITSRADDGPASRSRSGLVAQAQPAPVLVEGTIPSSCCLAVSHDPKCPRPSHNHLWSQELFKWGKKPIFFPQHFLQHHF